MVDRLIFVCRLHHQSIANTITKSMGNSITKSMANSIAKSISVGHSVAIPISIAESIIVIFYGTRMRTKITIIDSAIEIEIATERPTEIDFAIEFGIDFVIEFPIDFVIVLAIDW